MDQNLSKSYEVFYKSNQQLIKYEKSLKDLRKLVMMWMPNFQKYGFNPEFDEGIHFITADRMIEEGKEDDLWLQ